MAPTKQSTLNSDEMDIDIQSPENATKKLKQKTTQSALPTTEHDENFYLKAGLGQIKKAYNEVPEGKKR